MRRRPNILWIVTTQWRAQACGFAGDANARTPALDAFAARAAWFRQAVTPHPFGPFARAALLTGVPSPENGVREYFDPLPTSSRTVAHELDERGYRTAYFGKWHLAERDREAALVGDVHARMIVAPEARGGFSFWEGFEGGFLLNDPWLHGTRLPEPLQFRGYQADVLCTRAAEWLTQQSGPVFCVVSLETPHPPYAAPAAGVSAATPANLTLRPNVPESAAAQARRELAGYYAHIEATDRAIGRLLSTVDLERTAVVVTSVHGDMHGSHGLFRKGWPHEESVRVPLLASVPSGTAWRGARDDLVTLPDLPRWAMQWADGTIDLPANRAWQRLSMPSIVELPHQCDCVWTAMRSAGEKFVVKHVPGGPPEPWLWFNLTDDPHEQRNLWPAFASTPRASELRALVVKQ